MDEAAGEYTLHGVVLLYCVKTVLGGLDVGPYHSGVHILRGVHI